MNIAELAIPPRTQLTFNAVLASPASIPSGHSLILTPNEFCSFSLGVTGAYVLAKPDREQRMPYMAMNSGDQEIVVPKQTLLAHGYVVSDHIVRSSTFQGKQEYLLLQRVPSEAIEELAKLQGSQGSARCNK